MAIVDNFWAACDPSGGRAACWPWVRGINSHGYGTLTVDGRHDYAHRHAYRLSKGRPIPSGFVVMHTCDNPRCINPEHLQIGTVADNNADRDAKGRGKIIAIGEENSQSVLTRSDVLQIRERLQRGISVTDVAAEFCCGRATIWRINTKRTWAWL